MMHEVNLQLLLSEIIFLSPTLRVLQLQQNNCGNEELNAVLFFVKEKTIICKDNTEMLINRYVQSFL